MDCAPTPFSFVAIVQSYFFGNCYGTRIKDAVLKEKFVECYNEFIALKGEGDTLAELNQQLAWLLEQERELNALKVNRMIEIADYNTEWKAVR